MADADPTIALHRVLENMAREVGILAQKAYAIDEAMGDAICATNALEALPLELTQDVDLMRQSADCVTILLRNLATMTADGAHLEDRLDAAALTKGVYLSAIRDRVIAAPIIPKTVVEDQGDWVDL
ncbi:MAG: hypothetical protein AAFO72_00750 [Pseudomonadota bacterium]